MDYFLARYYSSPMGRFLSVDPGNVGARPGEPQTWNAFAYVHNSPLTFIDPEGTMDVGSNCSAGDSACASEEGAALRNLANKAGAEGKDFIYFYTGVGKGLINSSRPTETQVGSDLFRILAFAGIEIPEQVPEGEQQDLGAENADLVADVLLSILPVKGGGKGGRSGKQGRLREIGADPKASSGDRGWIRQEVNAIDRGNRTTIRNPPGKELAHERGREAAKGYSYEYSNLQFKADHTRQHKHDNYGRRNRERPVEE